MTNLFASFKSYQVNTNEYHVDYLKSLVDVIYQNATTKHLLLLFGEENIKLKGQLKGKTDKGKSFRVVF